MTPTETLEAQLGGVIVVSLTLIAIACVWLWGAVALLCTGIALLFGSVLYFHRRMEKSRQKDERGAYARDDDTTNR